MNEPSKHEFWDLLSDYEKYKFHLKQEQKFGYGKDKFNIYEYSTDENLDKFKNLKKWVNIS